MDNYPPSKSEKSSDYERPIRIQPGIYQGDSLSPLWFCLALNPLSYLLNRTMILVYTVITKKCNDWTIFYTWMILNYMQLRTINCKKFYGSLTLFQEWLLVRCVKLRKVTISVVMSVRPSVRMEQLGSQSKEFYDSWYLNIFRTSVRENQVQCNSDMKHGSLIRWLVDIYIYIYIFRSTSIVRGNISEKISRGNKTHILLQKTFLQEIVEKYCIPL